MGWYILKLLILLPIIGGMVWGSLKLSQVMQNRMRGPGGRRSVRVVETVMLSPTMKLAVLEFHGREILVSASRHGLVRLAEAPAASTVPDDGPDGFDDGFNDGFQDRPAPNFARTLRRTQG
ncbi:MAG: flagellar biosynthetic protein FliO [Sphingomonadales bacterium]|nr:flagellar biosynthetic protein FliO [Sphingomonadales bacterium]MDE2168886.1 flagellar biosynthetic protein FliO [Sphingomonadales bacterium]